MLEALIEAIVILFQITLPVAWILFLFSYFRATTPHKKGDQARGHIRFFFYFFVPLLFMSICILLMLYEGLMKDNEILGFLVFVSMPTAGIAFLLFFVRVIILKKRGIDQPQDHVKMFFQFFISILFIVCIFCLLLEDKISLGDGIPLFGSIIIYAADKFLIGFKSRPHETPISKADELKKWKELLDEGTISRHDFDKQKNKILNSR